MEYAKRTGKPVMLDFTGYGCENCRKMEAVVWTDPKVYKLMTEDYVLITLFGDNKTPLPEHIKVMENGKERTLRTIGDKWSYLQRSKMCIRDRYWNSNIAENNLGAIFMKEGNLEQAKRLFNRAIADKSPYRHGIDVYEEMCIRDRPCTYVCIVPRKSMLSDAK